MSWSLTTQDEIPGTLIKVPDEGGNTTHGVSTYPWVCDSDRSLSLDQLSQAAKDILPKKPFMKLVSMFPPTEGSKVVDKSTEDSKVVDKSTEDSKVVDKSTQNSKGVDKSTEDSKIVNKSTEDSKVVDVRSYMLPVISIFLHPKGGDYTDEWQIGRYDRLTVGVGLQRSFLKPSKNAAMSDIDFSDWLYTYADILASNIYDLGKKACNLLTFDITAQVQRRMNIDYDLDKDERHYVENPSEDQMEAMHRIFDMTLRSRRAVRTQLHWFGTKWIDNYHCDCGPDDLDAEPLHD